MRFPLKHYSSIALQIATNRLRSVKRFPLVLMLEPLHRCNLQCAGCGRIREYRDTLDVELSLEECLGAVDEAGAPVVTITGGEPLLYKEIGTLVEGILSRRKSIYLCTNGLLLQEYLEKLRPDPLLTLNVHVDGLEETHDKILGKPGLFRIATDAIKAAKKKGFRVSTNTTVYKETDVEELRGLLAFFEELGVDGILLSPAFDYEAVDQNIFLDRNQIHEKFKLISRSMDGRRLISTPIYMEFLRGERQLKCTPWGNPTRNPRGWKSPCYLITDTHYATFSELMEKTDWERFEKGEDPRCRNCMVHCGYEPTVVRQVSSSLSDLWKMIRWNIS